MREPPSPRRRHGCPGKVYRLQTRLRRPAAVANSELGMAFPSSRTAFVGLRHPKMRKSLPAQIAICRSETRLRCRNTFPGQPCRLRERAGVRAGARDSPSSGQASPGHPRVFARGQAFLPRAGEGAQLGETKRNRAKRKRSGRPRFCCVLRRFAPETKPGNFAGSRLSSGLGVLSLRLSKYWPSSVGANPALLDPKAGF